MNRMIINEVLLLKSVHLIFLIKRHELRWILGHIVLPVPATKLCCQCIPSPTSLVHWIVTTVQSSLLRSCHLLSAEVSRHRIDSPLVHNVLIYFNRVPVVEIVPGTSCWESDHSLSHQILLLLVWMRIRVRNRIRLFCCVMVHLNSLSCRGVPLFWHGSWRPDSSLTMGRRGLEKRLSSL